MHLLFDCDRVDIMARYYNEQIQMEDRQYIVWDLGATKCAAALVRLIGDEYHIVSHTKVKLKACDSLADMADRLHADLAVKVADIDAICIAGAGQYNGEELILENAYPFPMRFAKLAKQQQWPTFDVVHDYTPIVCSTFLPENRHAIRQTIHAGQFDPMGRRVAFGVGTGLGVKDAVLLANGEFWLGTNELGHIGITLPPKMNRVEATVHREFMRFLQDHDELHGAFISFETILSGKGLARIHQFVSGAKHRLTPEETASEIKASDDIESLKLFGWYLGLFVGALQLMFMPSGGIWIHGGVINKNLEIFNEPCLRLFCRGLKSSPAYWDMRQQFPTTVLQGPEHAFLGGAYYAHQRLEQGLHSPSVLKVS